MPPANAIVIGAGIGGLAAAAALRGKGWDVVVYERAPALEAAGAGIAMAPNALRALDTIGVGQRVRDLGVLQGDAGITRPDGRWLSRTSAEAANARYGDPTVLLHRAVLIEVLADALAPGTLRLGTPVTAVDATSGRVSFDGGEATADLVVAADGIRSGVRGALFPDHPGPVYAGVTSWRMLARAVSTPFRSTETWGRGLAFGAATLADGRVYCYATAIVPPGGYAPDEKAELVGRFGDWHAPIPELVASADTVLRTDLFCLDQPLPRFHAGRVALLGDAAHAMTPHLGQGGCQAIEDAVVLAHVTGSEGGLAGYTEARLERTSQIARRSRRIGRLTRFSHPVPVFLRDLGLRLAGVIGPGAVLKQMDPVFGWRPP